MQYGHFDDENKEYVIDKQDTPRPWSNYLGSTEYGAIITNHAGGYSFYRSAAQGRYVRLRFNSVPLDQPGRYFYIRDNEDGDYWSASWQPVSKPLDEFKSSCRHGTAYTKIDSEYKDIASSATYFVPLDRLHECWILELENKGSKERELSVFTYVEFASEWHAEHDLINLQFSQYVAKSDIVDGNIISSSMLENVAPDPGNFQNRDQGRFSYFSLIGSEVDGYDTMRESFIGKYRTYANPEVVEKGECSDSLAHGDNACGTLKTTIKLKPGEKKEMMVIMGVGKASEEGRKVRAEYNNDIGKARKELEELKQYWHSMIGAISCETPDSEFNSMINVWNAYNCLITYAWSRAASLVYQGERDGFGYRDTVQDLLGVLAAIPEKAGKTLELMISGQYSFGGAMPVVKPFAHYPGKMEVIDKERLRSDDCLWLFNTVPAYVKETGDISFYEKVIPYADKGEDSVLGHLRRALEFNIKNSGDHGLPCGLDADWNDCLRLGYTGESVFVTFQLRYGLKLYGEISRMLNKEDEAAWADGNLKELDKNIQEHTWDGEHFVRAFRDNGDVIGAKSEAEGSIFLNPQSWSVISGAAKEQQSQKAMEAVNKELATDYGAMVCAPPFSNADPSVIRAVILGHGQKENAGIFCHPQGWAVIAETMLGHGSRAYEYYRSYMPAAFNTKAEVREIEPYVHCQSTHSKYSRQYGVSRLPWLSGTATWSYFSATQHILGIRPEYEGLSIDPCIPSDWKAFSATRRFRGKDIVIKVDNSNGVEKGVKKLILNGEELAGSILPAAALRQKNDVTVVMG